MLFVQYERWNKQNKYGINISGFLNNCLFQACSDLFLIIYLRQIPALSIANANPSSMQSYCAISETYFENQALFTFALAD